MICICFGTNEKWTSRLICWATEAEYSHTWGEYPSSVWGGEWAAHSSSSGVVKVPAEAVRQEYPKFVAYECQADLSKGFEWARKYVGAKYDYGVIWNALLLVLYRFTKWRWLWNVVSRNDAKLSCSEFWASLFKNAEVPGAEKLDPELTTSRMLRAFCVKSDEFVRKYD